MRIYNISVYTHTNTGDGRRDEYQDRRDTYLLLLLYYFTTAQTQVMVGGTNIKTDVTALKKNPDIVIATYIYITTATLLLHKHR
jgi:hypothetical protein